MGVKIYKEVSSLDGAERIRFIDELMRLLLKLRDLYWSRGGIDFAAVDLISAPCRAPGLKTAYLHIIMCNMVYIFVMSLSSVMNEEIVYLLPYLYLRSMKLGPMKK